MITRRRLIALTTLATVGTLAATTKYFASVAEEEYDAAVRSAWRHSAGSLATARLLQQELVRYATLAPSSHNTQCWQFRLAEKAITILPDLHRRCPVVDPDDHHLFVSLGCATENLIQAALAHGFRGNGDGLFSRTTGNPSVPRWFGSLLFKQFLKAKNENEKYARHVRSSAGIAVFVSDASDREHWMESGRCFQRFALQATALGIRTAHLNQPVEVAALRPQFSSFLGLGNHRPDLVVRFGRGPEMPRSLRRPVDAVLI